MPRSHHRVERADGRVRGGSFRQGYVQDRPCRGGQRGATSIVGGGDSVSAVHAAGVAERLLISPLAAERRWNFSKARSCPAWKRSPTRNRIHGCPVAVIKHVIKLRALGEPRVRDLKGRHAPQKTDGRQLEDVQESRSDTRLFPRFSAPGCRTYAGRNRRLPSLH